jgi:hypothetical protein
VWAAVYTTTGAWALLKIDLQGRATTMLEDSRMTIGWAIPAPDGTRCLLESQRQFKRLDARTVLIRDPPGQRASSGGAISLEPTSRIPRNLV